MKFHLLKYLLPVLLLAGCSASRTAQSPATESEPLTPGEVIWFDTTSVDDSGMWLLPQIRGAVHAEMAEKGLRLPSEEIYSAEEPSLNQSIVRINIGESGGGTGSFLSSDGLILTNHHVAYDAIAGASTAQMNYLEDGFYARTNGDEIPVENYSLYIPIEQVEVTEKINSQIPADMEFAQRLQRKQKIEQELIEKRKGDNPNLVVEVDDYWSGNRQFMAVYRVINDVRLVHAPPSSIGKYGGDIDNWQWPRHTGDYAFLRAYVAPDGNAQPYSKANVPFRPDRYLRVDSTGVVPGDFTMLLGFPGTTYRYESSYAFDFYENQRNDILISSLQAILNSLELAAEKDPEAAVRTAADRASYANSLKYFRGVQRGFEKYNIVERRRAQEESFMKWVQEDSARIQKYGSVLNQLKQAYNIASQTGDLLYAAIYPLNSNALMQIAGLYVPYYNYLDKPEDPKFTRALKDSLLAEHRDILETIDEEAQLQMLASMLHTLVTLPDGKVPVLLDDQIASAPADSLKPVIRRFLQAQRDTSLVFDPDKAERLLSLPAGQAASLNKDEMVSLHEELSETVEFARSNYTQHVPYLLPAQQLYIEGMMEFRDDTTEYPDANFTLRLSGGRVRGYSPEDGTFYIPFTTLEGMIAKDTDEEPFDAPEKLEQHFAAVQSDTAAARPFFTPDGRMIVNFLSTNDITGGNSGSPVLDADGEVVGLAFDGNIEGVVGDYFYDPKLNRSISVDIRYILFLMNEFSNTNRLLQEIELVSE